MARSTFTKEQIDELSKIGIETGKETNQPIEDKVDTFLSELDIIHEIDRRVQDIDEAFDLAQEEEKERNEKNSKFRKIQERALIGLKRGQESIKSGIGSFGKSFGIKGKLTSAAEMLTSPFGIALGIILVTFVTKNIVQPITKLFMDSMMTQFKILDAINEFVPGTIMPVPPAVELKLRREEFEEANEAHQALLDRRDEYRDSLSGQQVGKDQRLKIKNMNIAIRKSEDNLDYLRNDMTILMGRVDKILDKQNETNNKLDDVKDGQDNSGSPIVINNDLPENIDNSSTL